MPNNRNLISDNIIREIMNNRKIKIKKPKEYENQSIENFKNKEDLFSEIPKKL